MPEDSIGHGMTGIREAVTRALPDPATEPTVDVERAASILGISRNSAYEAVRTGAIPSLTFGRRIRVPTAKLLELIGQPAA